MSFHFPPESAIVQYQLRIRDERLKSEDCQNQQTIQDECVNRVHRSGDLKYKVCFPHNNFEFVCLHNYTLLYLLERFMVFEAGSGQVVGQHQQEVKQLFPHER